MRRPFQSILAASAFAAVVSAAGTLAAASEVVYETDDPFGGFFGVIGFDVFTHQSVATRFTPQATFTLDTVMPWFMNNSGSTFPAVTMTLRNDMIIDGQSFPGDEILESWTFNISTLGWNPVQETLDSLLHPLLEEGKNYWLMAESDAAAMVNPVWNWAQPGNGWMSICNTHPNDPPGTCEWTAASTGAVVALTVLGTPAEPPCGLADLNCDGSVGVEDLLILLASWGECKDCVPGDPAETCPADLTGDCTVGVADLLVLLSKWG